MTMSMFSDLTFIVLIICFNLVRNQRKTCTTTTSWCEAQRQLNLAYINIYRLATRPELTVIQLTLAMTTGVLYTCFIAHWMIYICILRGSTHYCAIAPHCGFSGVSSDGNCAYVHWGSFSSNSSLGQSDEPSDLRGSLSPTTQHRCTHVLVHTGPGSARLSPIQ